MATTEEMTKTLEKERKSAFSDRRSFVNLGYTKMETAELVDTMNKLLANYMVHYQKLRNYHWNVKGPDFFDLHEEFEKQYKEAQKNIDGVAERIRVFGQTPLSTFGDYLKVSEIEETSTQLTSHEMVNEVLNDYKVLLEHMFNIIDKTIEVGDSGTEDMVKGFVKEIEKHHWMLTSFSIS